MSPSRAERKAQLGCLTAILLFAGLGFLVEHFGEHSKPGDDEGGGPIGAVSIVLLVLFFVIFAAIAAVRTIFLRGGAVRAQDGDRTASERRRL